MLSEDGGVWYSLHKGMQKSWGLFPKKLLARNLIKLLENSLCCTHGGKVLQNKVYEPHTRLILMAGVALNL